MVLLLLETWSVRKQPQTAASSTGRAGWHGVVTHGHCNLEPYACTQCQPLNIFTFSFVFPPPAPSRKSDDVQSFSNKMRASGGHERIDLVRSRPANALTAERRGLGTLWFNAAVCTRSTDARLISRCTSLPIVS